MRLLRRALIHVFAGLIHAVVLAGAATASSISEYDLKAAYIYNFAVFTEWPLTHLPDDTALSICAHDSNPLHRALEQVGTKGVKGRRLVVKSWQEPQIPQGCHILVLESADREQWKAMRQDKGISGMLTVADSEAALADVVITLALEGGRLRFRVDTVAAQRAQVVLSAKLLRLAETVQ